MSNFQNPQGMENQQLTNQSQGTNQYNYTPEQIQAYQAQQAQYYQVQNFNNQQGQENQQQASPSQDTNQQGYTQAQILAYQQQQQQLYIQQQQQYAQQQYMLQQQQQQYMQQQIQNQIPSGTQNQLYQPQFNTLAPQQSFQNPTHQQIQPLQPFSIPNFQNPNQDKIKQLNNQIKEKDTKIESLEQDIEELNKKNKNETQQLQKQINGLNYQITQLQEDERKKDEELSKYKNELPSTQIKMLQLEKKYKNQSEELQEKVDEISILQQNIFKLQCQTQNTRISVPDYEKQMQSFYDQQSAQLQDGKKKLSQLNEEKKNIENQLSEKVELINQLEQKIIELEKEIKKEHQYFLDARLEISNWQKKYDMLNKQLEQKDQSIDNLTQQIKDLKFKNSQLEEKLKVEQDTKAELQKQSKNIDDFYKNYINDLVKNKSGNQNTSKFEQDLQQLKNNLDQNLKKNEEEARKAQLQKEKDYQENKQKKAKQDQQRLENKKQENQMIKQIIMKKTQGSIEECGKLDICYVVDFTKSMEPYVEQARCCVQESLKVIKLQTNRDTIISSIAYYDIEQKPKSGNYHQFEFSNNIQNFQKFMLDVPIVGGQDIPEDVRGGLEQMIKNLQWKNKFKIAILITDSPCHGKKYHTIPFDVHPNDDITEILHRLIEHQIILIGFNLNDKTVKMYEEFKKIYEAKNASDFFIYVDVAGLKVDQLAEKMATSLGSASVNATQVKSSGTKSKKPQQERPKNKDGAIEALCKQGDFYNFEKQTKVVDTLFVVLNVTINDQVFNDNLQSINNIGKNPYKDFLVKEEGRWDCIRTEFPFAFGMMKDVFLMKKKTGGSEELYVIKTPLGSKPYQSKIEAIQECRSHLICQQLMKKFNNDIQEALEQKNIQKNQFPKVVYSDFLILEESKDKYWIAERFFKGDFVKYNNNYGYINDELTELNKFAQAFSYYTFFISKGQYMINDVQGVGTYFTDPAVNTSTGDFDDTDLGQEGQSMFLVNFQSKKNLAFEISNLLNLLDGEN